MWDMEHLLQVEMGESRQDDLLIKEYVLVDVDVGVGVQELERSNQEVLLEALEILEYFGVVLDELKVLALGPLELYLLVGGIGGSSRLLDLCLFAHAHRSFTLFTHEHFVQVLKEQILAVAEDYQVHQKYHIAHILDTLLGMLEHSQHELPDADLLGEEDIFSVPLSLHPDLLGGH